ncbi:hypothetical protein [Burkholderia sp. PU8-34]
MASLTGRKEWTVRDVLADAKAALESAPPARADALASNQFADVRNMVDARAVGQPEPRAEVTDDDKVCAARYRYARDNIWEGHELPGGYWLSDTGDEWDKAIDAARAGDCDA